MFKILRYRHVLHSKCCYVLPTLPPAYTTHHNMPWCSKACGVWATTGSVMLVFIARSPPMPILQAPRKTAVFLYTSQAILLRGVVSGKKSGCKTYL